MIDQPGKGDAFINEFIPRVSRTFALAIKFLPENLRRPVYSAYLLCRLADTIEDSPQLVAEEKSRRLRMLRAALMAVSEGGQVDRGNIREIQKSIDFSEGFDHQLLGKAPELFEILAELPGSQRNIIYRWAAEMAGGMAEFSGLTVKKSNEIAALKDVAEWDRYCYFVAGTVGNMLTELFILELDIPPDTAREMKRLCNSFGLGLQKVNTIKDVPDDRLRGIIFLPRDQMGKHGLAPDTLTDPGMAVNVTALVEDLAAMAFGHLDDAVAYSALFPESLSGVRMFLIVPVFLAASTLNAILTTPVQTMTGPPVKISRPEVIRLTALAGICSISNSKLIEQYSKLRGHRQAKT